MTAEPVALRAPAGAPLRAPVALDGRTLTPATVAAIAHGGAGVRLTDAARARNAASRAALEAVIAAGTPVYGVTTGVGALHDRPVAPANASRHQRALLRSHAAGAGEPLAPAIVRAAMAVRLNQLGAGGAGASDGLLDALAAALGADVIPVVLDVGSLGTGDLPELAAIGLALLGEGDAWVQGRPVRARGALRRAGLEPLVPGPRDAMALLSSNAVTIGRAALAAVRARRLADAALPGGGAVVRGDRRRPGRPRRAGPRRAADPGPGRRGRADAHAARRHAVAAPRPGRPRPALVPLPAAGRRRGPRRARRARPRARRRAQRGRREPAAGGLRPSPTCSPAATSTPSRSRSPSTACAAALAQAATIVAARASALLDDRFSGLRGWLAGPGEASSGAMAVEYAAHAAAAEVRLLAAPAAAQHTVVGAGMESHSSFAALSVLQTDRALDAYADALATELVLAARALRLAGRPAGGEGTRALFEAAAAGLPAGLEDRPLADGIRRARALLGA